MKEIKIFLSIFLVGVFFTGCSIQKRCQAPELNLPDEIIAGENDTLTIADMAWWELYSDTTLTNLINKTLNNNRNMRAAEAHIRQMEELYRVSKASLFPTINGLVGGNRETNAYYGEKTSIDPEFSLKASLSWEADLWGSLRWSKRKGAAEYLSSVEAARAMQMTLIAETATAYFELVALDQELEIVLQTVQTREESVNQARLRFEGGLTSETAYQQAQVELANASALIPNLEQKIAMKENQIAVLSGEYPSRLRRITCTPCLEAVERAQVRISRLPVPGSAQRQTIRLTRVPLGSKSAMAARSQKLRGRSEGSHSGEAGVRKESSRQNEPI